MSSETTQCATPSASGQNLDSDVAEKIDLLQHLMFDLPNSYLPDAATITTQRYGRKKNPGFVNSFVRSIDQSLLELMRRLLCALVCLHACVLRSICTS
jgi:hypothetical protein